MVRAYVAMLRPPEHAYASVSRAPGAVPLLAQGLARLRAGVVELAGLADHDRTRANDQNAVDIGALGHLSPISNAETPRRRGILHGLAGPGRLCVSA